MDNERKIALLRMFYAAALADSLFRLGNEGALERTTASKRGEQIRSGGLKAKQLGVQKPEERFSVLTEIFGCANWTVEQAEEGFTAVATSCMLCGLA